jgi:hypothetical protein
MCFSAEADFVSGAVIGVIGVVTLTKVEKPRELALGILPLAFALHQIVEGFVWKSLSEPAPHQGDGVAVYMYVLFAWVVLPILAPLAILLVERDRRRRNAMWVFVALGSLAGVYLLGAVMGNDISAHITEHTIQYGGAGRYADIATGLYVIATCGAPLLSSYRQIRWFGVANIAAVAVIAAVQAEGLTSVWCAWAAVVSVLIYAQFVAWRRSDREPRPMAVV